MERNIKSKLLTVLLVTVMFIGVMPNTVHAALGDAELIIDGNTYYVRGENVYDPVAEKI